MNILLDTQTLIWWLEDPRLLSKEARIAIRDGKNAAYVSAAVIWEMVLKASIGKLVIPGNIESVLLENKFAGLPVTSEHAVALQTLPDYHKDPFDRILIAQAKCEGFVLVTRDEMIQNYPIPCIAA